MIDAMAQNLLFLRALAAHADRLRELMGDAWPAFRDRLEQTFAELERAESDALVSLLVDEITEAALNSPAKDLVRSLYPQATDSEASSVDLKSTRRVAIRDLATPEESALSVHRKDVLEAARLLAQGIFKVKEAIIQAKENYLDRGGPKAQLPKRYFATRIEGGPETSGKQPRLIVGKRYDCVFGIKAEIDSNVGLAVEVPLEDLAKMLKREVKVFAGGEGLEFRNNLVPLTIHKDYTSVEAAVNFNAMKPGPCSLQLILMLDGNTVRTIRYDFLAVTALDTISEAPPASQLCEWPTLEEYHRLRKQELTILVSGTSNINELRLQFLWGTDSNILLPLTVDARSYLEKIQRDFLSHYTASMQHVRGARLTKQACKDFLQELSMLGEEIYRTLFVLPGPSDLSQIGKDLRAILSKGPAPIQINPGTTHLPWMFLSDGKGALGLRHEVEIIPIGGLCPDLDLTRKPLRMVCGLAPVFEGITFEDGRSVLDAQREALAMLPEDRFEVRLAKDEQEWLAELGSPADVIYAYCHGSGGAGDPCLWMNQRAKAISGNTIDSSESIDWSRHPLVILAACESGTIDPFRAVGLVNSFITRGARGYIAVEGGVPTAFASLFMKEFFEEFFVKGGQPVGDVLFNLRSRFLEKMNNPWGILFTQFCRSEIAVLNV